MTSESDEKIEMVAQAHRVKDDPIVGTARFLRKIAYYAGRTVHFPDAETGQLVPRNTRDTGLRDKLETPEGAAFIAGLLTTMASDIYELYIQRAELANRTEMPEVRNICIDLASQFGLIAHRLELFLRQDVSEAARRLENNGSGFWDGLVGLVPHLERLGEMHGETIEFDLERLQLHLSIVEKCEREAQNFFDDPLPLFDAVKRVAFHLGIGDDAARARLKRAWSRGDIRTTGERKERLVCKSDLSRYLEDASEKMNDDGGFLS